MIHTLQQQFKYSDFINALQSHPMEWRINPEWAESMQLICGDYIAACVWPLTESSVTWRTGFCGAHNSAGNYEEGKQACESYIKHCLIKGKYAAS